MNPGADPENFLRGCGRGVRYSEQIFSTGVRSAKKHFFGWEKMNIFRSRSKNKSTAKRDKALFRAQLDDDQTVSDN